APIDILNRAAPLVIVSLGMTLVIATRGIDISVGAIVAIAGAAAAVVLADDPTRVGTALGAALAVGVLAGIWNGMLVAFVGMQPI
ncbi:ABC transporter permease subunit, partial [Paraburkholderia sp. SIMBA_053]